MFLNLKKIIGSVGKNLLPNERLHHIDGVKTNNNITNLVLCDSEEQHQKIHEQIISLLAPLLARGVVRFNRKTMEYYVEPEIQQLLFPQSLGFDDVALLQNKNVCLSRLDAHTKSEVFRGVYREVPLIASNMSSVVNADFCIKLYELGALGVMHRAASDDMLSSEVNKISQKCDIVCASVGIGDDQMLLCKKLVNAGANVIFVDVAHGYSDFVIEMGKNIKKEFGVKVVLGNTINENMIYETYEFVDALKVGIANGLSCKTKNTASCNEKQFSSIYKFRELAKEFSVPIIGDGGIREPADFVKSISAGANSAMAGSIFAKCPESAAKIVEIDGQRKKVYAGMASREVQEEWKNGVKRGTCTEGKITYLELGEPIENLLDRYTGALRSGITYSGGRNIIDLQKLARFVKV
jgi:IMP dehydrogenase